MAPIPWEISRSISDRKGEELCDVYFVEVWFLCTYIICLSQLYFSSTSEVILKHMGEIDGC